MVRGRLCLEVDSQESPLPRHAQQRRAEHNFDEQGRFIEEDELSESELAMLLASPDDDSDD